MKASFSAESNQSMREDADRQVPPGQPRRFRILHPSDLSVLGFDIRQCRTGRTWDVLLNAFWLFSRTRVFGRRGADPRLLRDTPPLFFC